MLKNSKHLLLHHLRSLVQFTMQRYCFILNNKDWEIKNVGMIELGELCFQTLGTMHFELSEQCFQTLGALLLDSQSIAFGLSEHCFRTLRALLSERQSIALDYKEHCS